MKRLIVFPLAAIALFSLPLLAQNGTLKVKANPGRAGVFLDGKYLGPAANFGISRKYAVPAGEHELKLVEPRYQEVTKKVTVEAGKQLVVSEKMTALPLVKPPFAILKTESADKFAAVYINDKYYGHAGEFNNCMQALLMPPGEYEVKIVPASGAPVTQKVKLEANKTTLVK